MKYTPRKYAGLVNDLIFTHARCNLFASCGMGKTVMVASALESLSLVEDDVYPVLILAPLRVADTSWGNEYNMWEHLSHIKVSKILGSPKERVEALHKDADVYVMNYDNLEWLEEECGGKSAEWKFKTIVADESTRLKNLRVHYRKRADGKLTLCTSKGQGSSRAAALARHAIKTKRFINLTGTPAPQGLADLWGQNWFIDFGRELGSSFSRFQAQWFHQVIGEHARYIAKIPFSHSMGEVTKRISPYTLTLDAKDWFPLTEPRQIIIPVKLPPAALSMYKKMLNEFVVEVEGDTKVAALNAAAKTTKLIQIASGAVIETQTDTESPRSILEVHSEKIKALESIVEDTWHEPLLVVYHYRHDCERILKRFPKAEVLAADSKAQQDRWNKGEIEMLLVHPQSAGHGISLQHGGYRIVFFTLGWSAELFEQVRERLGATRQFQSGYDRIVEEYYIEAEGTIDKQIRQVVNKKIDVQSAIKNLTKPSSK